MLGTLVFLVLLGLLSAAIVKAYQRLYFHQLSHIPGPKIAITTDLYWIYHELIRDGKRIEVLKRLHEEYGPVVRIGPSEVHFNDPKAFEEIYVRYGHKFPKEATFYEAFLQHESSFGYLNPRDAKTRKDVLRPLFSRQAILKLEHVIQATVDKLIYGLINHIPPKGEVEPRPADLTFGYLCTTLDIITSYCFARSFNTLSAEATSFGENAVVVFMESIVSMYCWFQHFPFVIPIIKLAIFQGDKKDDKTERSGIMVWIKELGGPLIGVISATFDSFKSILLPLTKGKSSKDEGAEDVEGKAGKPKSVNAVTEIYKVLEAQVDLALRDPDSLDLADHAIIYHQLVKKGSGKNHANGESAGHENAHSPPSKQSLLNEAATMLGAGAETVRNTCLIASYHVLSNKRILNRLRTELKENWREVDSVMCWEKLEKLPYLTAIIKESLRFSPGVVSPLPRVATETTTLGSLSTVIPAGTTVSMGIPMMHANPLVFPDHTKFIPERWIEGESPDMYLGDHQDADTKKDWAKNTKEQIRERDAHLVAFSKGPRSCLGINLAWCELYLILGNVFRKLDLEIHDTTESALLYRTYLTPKYHGHVKVLVKGIVED
ncbi:hypothetical protein AX16_002552 [Volvariella volvacea WC 439]|nr:hypothetical protein AX16_002552 [Volvariella volvacea WC 439]